MTTAIAIPEQIGQLPTDEAGRPVPWFVARPNGRPDLRLMDPAKITTAIGERRCWICGQPLNPPGRLRHRLAFIVGPISLYSRATSEPPSHRLCALYALRECPFLSTPGRHRREARLPEGIGMAGAPMLDNPGVVLVWLCHDYRVEADPNGRVLLRLPHPVSILAYHAGQPALRDQLDAAFADATTVARQDLADAGMPDPVIDTVVAMNRQLLYAAVMRP